MKKFFRKVRSFFDREYFLYTFLFLVIMVVIYLYLNFGDMGAAPKFTYAEF